MAAMDITKDSKMMDLYSRQIGAFGVGVMSKLVQARAPLNERHSNHTQIPTPQPRPRRRFPTPRLPTTPSRARAPSGPLRRVERTAAGLARSLFL